MDALVRHTDTQELCVELAMHKHAATTCNLTPAANEIRL